MSDYIYTSDGELYHYGIPGMKWGKRKVRGHAGPGRYLTKKRQLAGDKKDLEYLNKGGHLSVGLTKKRQAAYDAKDRARLERRIAKNEQRLSAKTAKKEQPRAEKKLKNLSNKSVSELRGKTRSYDNGRYTTREIIKKQGRKKVKTLDVRDNRSGTIDRWKIY